MMKQAVSSTVDLRALPRGRFENFDLIVSGTFEQPRKLSPSKLGAAATRHFAK